MQQKIYIAGHNGMVGSAIVRQLQNFGDMNLNSKGTKYRVPKIIARTRRELDLTNQQQVNEFIKQEQPDQIYLAAAKVGGIHANNTYPADFIYQNLMIEANVINGSFLNCVGNP